MARKPAGNPLRPLLILFRTPTPVPCSPTLGRFGAPRRTGGSVFSTLPRPRRFMRYLHSKNLDDFIQTLECVPPAARMAEDRARESMHCGRAAGRYTILSEISRQTPLFCCWRFRCLRCRSWPVCSRRMFLRTRSANVAVKMAATAERCHLRIPAARRQFETLIPTSANSRVQMLHPLGPRRFCRSVQ